MRVFRPLMSAGESMLDRILCVLGAAAVSQWPEFMQQYLQRLGGHLDEARRQLAQYAEIARRAGKTVQELAAQYSASPEGSVAAMGKLVGETRHRADSLAAAEAAIRGASVWTRPFVFLRNLDLDIAHGTAGAFRPAVPTTAEGAVYALAGVLLALLAYHGLVRPTVRTLCRRPREKGAPAAAAAK